MLRLFIVVFLFQSAVATAAMLWTNQAGRVIEGELMGVEGSTVMLLRTNGALIKVPLSALRAPDQQRALAATGRSAAPDFVKAAYRDATEPLVRLQRLPPDQQTVDARSAAANMACLAYDSRIESHKAELTNAVARAEAQRLRRLLANGIVVRAP